MRVVVPSVIKGRDGREKGHGGWWGSMSVLCMACSGKKTLSAITSGCILKEKGGWVGTSSLFPVKISKLEKDVYNTEKEFYKLERQTGQ